MNDKLKKIIRKKNKSKIVCLTAYSKNIASILDNHCDIILVGDSAWMPKPIDAGVIGPALIAGTILGKNVVDAIEANDVTEKG